MLLSGEIPVVVKYVEKTQKMCGKYTHIISANAEIGILLLEDNCNCTNIVYFYCYAL